MFSILKHGVVGLFGCLLLGGGVISTAQQGAPQPSPVAAAQASLADVVRKLPEYTRKETQLTYFNAIENATSAERDAAIPRLMRWLDDERPEVRSFVLLSLSLLYLPSEKRPDPSYTASIPLQYVPAVAARLRDPELAVRIGAFSALQSVGYSGVGMEELTKLVVPMLREPDVVTEYPDPFFVESDKRTLAGMTPEEQAQYRAHRPTYKLPAEGTLLLGLLTMPRRHLSVDVDDAMIAFLDRKDLTKTALGECLHVLALSYASERVNDDALRRVFERKAMTVFLLQFLPAIRLTPAQFIAQKQRLLELANDESARPALRRGAKAVAACWDGDRTRPCMPDSKDFNDQLDTP